MANNDKLKELLEKTEEGIKAVFESENYKKYLATMSKFHSYSARNSLLILLQNPDATYVAGYAAWKKKFHRHVKRGERGINIIGYSPRKISVPQPKKDRQGNPVLDPDGRPMTELVTKQIPSYMPVTVFDVSQTDGEPLPQLVGELTGSVESYDMLMAAIQQVSPFPITFEDIPSGAKGYCDFQNKCIVIQQGMSEAQSVKTAIHEVTHADLHAPEQNLTLADRPDQRTREVEAESTAYVVCEHYGIDTSDYTFPYVASWSSSKELVELQNSLDKIQQQASDLIDKIDNRLAELTKEISIVVDTEEKTAPGMMPSRYRMDDAGHMRRTWNGKLPEEFTVKDNLAFMADTDILLHGKVTGDTLSAIQQAGYDYINGEVQEHMPKNILRVRINPYSDSSENSHILQEYIPQANGMAKLGDMLYTGTLEKCSELQKQLEAGILTPDQVKNLPESQEESRRYEEQLDSVRFDGDIDLDKEKTREQLGFRDDPQPKMSIKDRMAAAQAEADRRGSLPPDTSPDASLSLKLQHNKDNQERG